MCLSLGPYTCQFSNSSSSSSDPPQPSGLSSHFLMLLGRVVGLGTCCSSGAQACLYLSIMGLSIMGLPCLLPFPRCLERYNICSTRQKMKNQEDPLGPWVGSPGVWGLILISATPGCRRECQSMKQPCNTQLSLPGTAGVAV